MSSGMPRNRPLGRSFLIVACGWGLLMAAASARAGGDRARELAGIADSAYPQLDRLYKTLHQSPELSLAEMMTARLLADELRKAGYAVTMGVGGHSVVAVMENGPGPVVMIRTDLDALPVKEQTGAEYASNVTATDAAGKKVDVMHACGHDVHMTCLVGVAGAMAK